MKKRLILAALLSVGVLVGCGNPGSSSEPSSEPTSSEVSSESSSEASSESSSESSSSEETQVSGWGTETAPITVAQAIEKMKDWTGTEWSEVEGYLTGKVVSISKSSYGDYNAVLESTLTGNESFEIYGAYINEGVVEPVAGSTITVKGHFTKYVKSDGSVVKYEVAFSKPNSYRPYIIASDAVATEPEKPSSSENTSSEPNTPSGEGYVINFSGLTGQNEKIDSTALDTIKGCLGSNASALTSASATNVYSGNGTGGAHPNSSGFLKFGKSGTDGTLTLTFSNVSFTTAEIVCHDWYTLSSSHPTNSNKVSVNGGTEVLAPYNETGAGEKLTFTFEESSTITIVANDRIFCWSITLY